MLLYMTTFRLLFNFLCHLRLALTARARHFSSLPQQKRANARNTNEHSVWNVRPPPNRQKGTKSTNKTTKIGIIRLSLLYRNLVSAPFHLITQRLSR